MICLCKHNFTYFLYRICQTFCDVVSEYSVECNVVTVNMVNQSGSRQVLSFSVWLLLQLQVMSDDFLYLHYRWIQLQLGVQYEI